MIKKQTIQKRSFLLFELLLAMGLLILCLFPMIKTHVTIVKEERKQLREILEPLKIYKAICDLKIDLHEHRYSWEELMKGAKNDKYVLKKLKQSTKINQESGMILNAILLIEGRKIERTIYVEKTLNYTG
ncbi:MAG: hypothetical protein R3E91_03600 [Chlamydiales bacterium]